MPRPAFLFIPPAIMIPADYGARNYRSFFRGERRPIIRGDGVFNSSAIGV